MLDMHSGLCHVLVLFPRFNCLSPNFVSVYFVNRLIMMSVEYIFILFTICRQCAVS